MRGATAGAAQLTRSFAACRLGDIALVGGKVARLGELIHAGFPVPPGFVLGTDAYAGFLGSGPGAQLARMLAATTGDDPAALAAASRRIRDLIETSPVADAIAEQLALGYRRLAQAMGVDLACVAVRSSATSECLATHSFAGQQETWLWVKGTDALLARTRQCWSSLFTAQAMAYRRSAGFPPERALIAVGVQAMVDARAAGVLFTLNPGNGDPSKIVIEAGWGFGESVVAGEVDPDRYLVDKVTLHLISATIADKVCEYQVDGELDAVRKMAVPAGRRTAPCLSAREVMALAALAKRVERHFGVPQDIEWAIDRHAAFPGNIVLLQSRPETTWNTRQPRPDTARPGAAVNYVMRALKGSAPANNAKGAMQ
ncbi:PEP/pyruvate-binding domain-containing protein [Massilia sp. CCM 9210]|uniref:PEP/pyruvate-binding domain-containing protein n=1 Tax=Massilia scottii TaxID=3057166 RepID=UPI002796B84C|nr:PEP/pyruvate-binding domain-containing protein [Massilia sp. CCM 9210]MDQ1817120.1 PEP/pyruvate-binding domain-containing protein [Massilia sp. CCM 9210]